MFSYKEVIHLNTQYTTLNLYTNLSVVKEEIAFIQASKKKMKKIEKVNKVKDLFRVHRASVFFSRLLWPRVIIDLHFSINKT